MLTQCFSRMAIAYPAGEFMDQAEQQKKADDALASLQRSFDNKLGIMETQPETSAAQILGSIRDPNDWRAVTQKMIDQNSASSQVLIDRKILGPVEGIDAKVGPG